MADQLTGQVSGIAGGAGVGGLGTLTGALQGGVSNLIDTGSGYMDRWFPPDKREQVKSQLAKFATEKPKLASFVFSQIALSGVPLALFFIMSISVVIFALLAGIIVGVVGALLFIVFCIGIALLFLLPTLFITTFAAVFIWLWGVGAYYLVKWFNQKEIPGIHTDFKSGIQKQLGLENVPALNGELPPPPPKSQPAEERQKKAPKVKKENHHDGDDDEDDEEEHGPKKQQAPNQHANHANHANGTAKTGSAPKKLNTTSGKATGADVGGAVGDIKKKTPVGGLTDAVGV